MRTLGVEKAMNLDGGSSSCLYYKGKTVYGKVNDKGSWVKRELFSILFIQKINKNTSQPST
jgi:exopolysaccharide biosynthesis protein